MNLKLSLTVTCPSCKKDILLNSAADIKNAKNVKIEFTRQSVIDDALKQGWCACGSHVFCCLECAGKYMTPKLTTCKLTLP